MRCVNSVGRTGAGEKADGCRAWRADGAAVESRSISGFCARVSIRRRFPPHKNLPYQNQNIWCVYWKCVAPGRERTTKSPCHTQHPRNVEREILKVNVKSFSSGIFDGNCELKSGKWTRTETKNREEAIASEVQWIWCDSARFPGHFNDFSVFLSTSNMKKIFEKRKVHATVLVFVKSSLQIVEAKSSAISRKMTLLMSQLWLMPFDHSKQPPSHWPSRSKARFWREPFSFFFVRSEKRTHPPT